MGLEARLYTAGVIGAGILCLGGCALAAIEGDWPAAALLLALAHVVLAGHLGLRSVERLLRRHETQQSTTHAELRAQQSKADAALQSHTESLSRQEHLLSQGQIRSRKTSEQLHDDVREVIRRLKIHYKALSTENTGLRSELRRSSERLPGEVLDLWRVGSLLPQYAQIPLPGDWAVTVPTLVSMLNEVGRNPQRKTILECGSGTSTVWMAFALRQRGHGHIYAMEHEPRFAEATREFLRINDLERWATVVEAPLIEVEVEGDLYWWYDLRCLPDMGPVDLLFIDGPPEATGEHARYPALPLLADRLADGAWLVLDDTVRLEEKEIAERWLGSDALPVRLTVLRELPKSMIMAAHRCQVRC